MLPAHVAGVPACTLLVLPPITCSQTGPYWTIFPTLKGFNYFGQIFKKISKSPSDFWCRLWTDLWTCVNPSPSLFGHLGKNRGVVSRGFRSDGSSGGIAGRGKGECMTVGGRSAGVLFWCFMHHQKDHALTPVSKNHEPNGCPPLTPPSAYAHMQSMFRGIPGDQMKRCARHGPSQ